MEKLIFIKYHLELLINCVDIDIYLRTKSCIQHYKTTWIS